MVEKYNFRFGPLRAAPDGEYVKATDYDATSSHALELHNRLDHEVDKGARLAQTIVEMHEKIAFLESREVCAAAHENVETCGYCQRDQYKEALVEIAGNGRVPANLKKFGNAHYRSGYVSGFEHQADIARSALQREWGNGGT
jgi:hypothetical protein